MVNLSGGQDGPLEHGFSNTVFILPGFVFITLSGVQEGAVEQQAENVNNIEGSGNFEMPSLEKLLEMIGGLNMTEEEREELKESIISAQTPKFVDENNAYDQFLILVFAVSLIIVVFVFFGYKLYKSLVEKERKRDEKRKQKQQKKKK